MILSLKKITNDIRKKIRWLTFKRNRTTENKMIQGIKGHKQVRLFAQGLTQNKMMSNKNNNVIFF